MDKTTRARTGTARTRLLDAAILLIRRKGFAGTTVDELCAVAGVTKGAFFHHFASKDALGSAAAAHWTQATAPRFASATYHDLADPLDRVLGYLDLRRELITGPIESFTCLAGTLAQEVFATRPDIRAACGDAICGHAHTLEADLRLAIAHRDAQTIDATGLALHIQAVLQGSFVLAKATGDAQTARDSIAHLRRYIELLFATADPAGQAPPSAQYNTGSQTPDDTATDTRSTSK